MHRAIGYLSKRFVQVKPGEGRRVLLTFLYFFLIITAYYVIKPVSRSLALGELGSKMVPYMDLVCALVMGPVVTLFARCVDTMSKQRLVSGAFLLITLLMVGFWKLLDWSPSWAVAAFYVWVSIFSVMVVTLFWLVANDLYRPREAKRLFGFIGSGGILGGVVGSSVAAFGAHLVGTKQLLLVSAAILFVCWIVVQQLWHLAPDRAHAEAEPAKAKTDTFLANVRGFVQLLMQSRYLLLLVALVGLNKLIATLTYYQFNPFIEQTFTNADARTTFTSLFFGAVNVGAFIVQFFLTSWVLRRWGLSLSLMALPVGLFVGTLGIALVPSLLVAAATELYDGSLNYSLQQTSKEVLYLPIDRSIRYKVKPFIDMVVFRFGKGIAAIIGIVILNGFNLSPRIISLISLPLIVVWLMVAFRLRREYVVTIRTMLQARAATRRTASRETAQELMPGTGHVSGIDQQSQPFGSLTDGQPSSRKLALVGQLIALKSLTGSATRELLDELAAYEHRFDHPAELDAEHSRLKAAVIDQTVPMAKRRQAIRMLARMPDQTTVDFLLGIVMVDIDALLRHEAVRGLVKMRLRNLELEFPIQTIRRQIQHEVENYQRIVQVALVCRRQDRGELTPNDPMLQLFRALIEESLEQVFRLLMLVYRPEDIHLVYEQLKSGEGYVRTDAIELLDNLIDAPMRAIVMPVLDEDRFLAMVEESDGVPQEPTVAYRVLQEAIWDHHGWLSVTAMCAVGRLRLTTMRQELERASRHSTPLIASAAKVALELATS